MTRPLTARQRGIRLYHQGQAWQRRSWAYRMRHRSCEACGQPVRARRGADPGLTLDAHHITYLRARNGGELDRDLVALCRACHDHVHNLTRRRWFPLSLRAATNRVLTMHGRPARRRTFPQWLRDVA